MSIRIFLTTMWVVALAASTAQGAEGGLLPAPAVTDQAGAPVTTVSLAYLRSGGRLLVSLREATRDRATSSQWSLYLVDVASNEIRWSAEQKGAPPDAIPWDGRFDDGASPESGKTYAFKAVLQIAGKHVKTAAASVTFALVGTDAVEVNEIAQSVGVSAFNLRSTNGLRMRRGTGSVVDTRLRLANIVVLDLFLMKELDVQAFEPSLAGARKPMFAHAETIATLHLDLGAFGVSAGGGMVFSAANVPYLQVVRSTAFEETGAPMPDQSNAPEVETIAFRNRIQAPVAGVALRYTRGAFEARLRGTASRSRGGPHRAGHLALDYMLSHTWYAGFAASLVKVDGTEDGAPGFTARGAGLHIGLKLSRG